MAGTAKKFWNLSRNNKKATVVAAYTSIADKCSANIDSAMVNTHGVLKGWHYFDQGSQANREKWGECEMFWRQNVSQKVLKPALESCVMSERKYRDEHGMDYVGPRKVVSVTSGSSSSSGGSSSSSGGSGKATTTVSASVPALADTDNGGRTKKWILLAVAVVAGVFIFKKK